MIKRVPPYRPDSPPKMMLVGEAPSNVEEAKGMPFVGPVGRVLDMLLRSAHINRWDAWLTNAIDFKLPGNEVEKLPGLLTRKEALAYTGPAADWVHQPVASGKYLPPELVEEQIGRLRAEIEEARPNIIVALGGLAIWAVMAVPGHGVVSKARGTLHRSHALYGGIKTLPTFHPGYVNKNWQAHPLVIADLAKARTEQEFPEIIDPVLDLYVPDTVDDLEYYMDTWVFSRDPARTLIAADIETPYKTKMQALPQIDCIGFCVEPMTALTIPLFDTTTGRHYWSTPEEEFRARKIINRVLAGPWQKLFQNGSFDVQWIWEKWRVKTRNYTHDTRLLHHALWPELPKSLGSMAATHTNLAGWKPFRGKNLKRED